ncbi:hypothetical protein DXG03_007080 [Asterophora parasitica]|uniref:Uncharacterized protein n=1 Tax=Asterophora parasitica TaxID=117018 RepID=A0A9P7KGR0_9AGAR|nr:hypothetical protein DXG03_007080 [Asterophora parasitica]
MMIQCPELPLHAPAPIPGQSSALLSPENYHHDPATNLPPADQFRFAVEGHPPQLAPHHDSQKAVHHPEYESPSATFPTPSEMLNDLAGGPSVLPSPPIVGPRVLDSKTETARKARRRAMAENIGFMPTDPCAANPAVPKDPLIPSLSDTISSHEKKRNYLECLEYYVMYLHEQLELVRSRPATLQRVSNPGRGMSSRSIRTVLVHMESVNRRLNQQILAEEQRFVHLRASVSEEAGLQECHMQFNNAQQ